LNNNDFELYKTELREAYLLAIKDIEYLKERASYHPKLDIVKSLEKSCKDYWATEAGWKKKKVAKTSKIDWRATFNNALSLKTNQVWLRDNQVVTSSESGYAATQEFIKSRTKNV
jgi:hypothetical protein